MNIKIIDANFQKGCLFLESYLNHKILTMRIKGLIAPIKYCNEEGLLSLTINNIVLLKEGRWRKFSLF